ncbi:MAG: AAA family ATPase, partial [Lachnospirales bacterium]
MIDFGKLVDANIFGVFGSVGSGKSTILEAISYALYGEVDRMNRAGRNYNMLNLKSNELLIDFEFRNFEDIEYRVLVKGKRNSKQFEDVKAFTKTAYQKINKEWEAIENFERDVEQIVGLSYINFRRTIIIPQGKFQEFLQLGSKDRTEMLKEIFNLGKFDLSSKTAAIDSANEAKLQTAQGSLQQLEEYTEDVVSQLEKEITAKQAELGILVDKQKKKKQEYEEQKLIKELSDKLKSAQQEFEKLALQKPHIEQLELSLKNFNLYTRLFKSDLDFCKHKKKSIDEKNQRLSGIDKSLEDKHKMLEAKKQALAEVEQQKENIPTLTKQAEEYRMLVQMQESSDKIAKLKQRREKGRETIEETRRNKNILEEKLKEQKDKNKVFTKKQEEYFKLKERELAVSKFLSTKADLQKIKDKEREQLAFAASKQLELQGVADEYKVAGKDISSELKNMALKLSEKIDKLNDEKSSLLIHRELGSFVSQLHDGKACPLCGSAEHPKVLAVENVDDELAALTAKMDRSIQEKQELEKAELNSLSISEAISTLKKELLDLDIQIKERATEVDTQRELLLASGGEKLAPDEIKSHIQQLSAELEELKIIT